MLLDYSLLYRHFGVILEMDGPTHLFKRPLVEGAELRPVHLLLVVRALCIRSRQRPQRWARLPHDGARWILRSSNNDSLPSAWLVREPLADAFELVLRDNVPC